MSSTNRSEARKSHISDYYITPLKDIECFIYNLILQEGNIFNNAFILDPCSGGDNINPMSYPEVLKKYSNNIETIDLREDSKANIKANYLEYNNLKTSPDIIITNPPFNIALDIIKKSLNDVKNGGYVIMLLRLNFFGSKARFDFWQKNMPKYTFVHSKRISFLGTRNTDSIEYMHCVWQKGCNPKFTQLKII